MALFQCLLKLCQSRIRPRVVEVISTRMARPTLMQITVMSIGDLPGLAFFMENLSDGLFPLGGDERERCLSLTILHVGETAGPYQVDANFDLSVDWHGLRQSSSHVNRRVAIVVGNVNSLGAVSAQQRLRNHKLYLSHVSIMLVIAIYIPN